MTAPVAPTPGDSDLPRWLRAAVPVVGHILREDASLLTRWRARTLAAFFVACATLGLAPYIALVFLAFEAKLWALLALDTTILAGVYVMLFSRRVSNDARAMALTVSSFSIGTLAIISRGPVSASLGWLFISVFLASFLLGRRATTFTVVGTLLVLIGVAIGIRTEQLPWVFRQPDLFRAWVLTLLNFAFLIVVFAVTNVTIIGLLEREDRARSLAEAQLAEARRHEALGTLAGGIAHDFNNLLVPMLANVTAVHDELPTDSVQRSALLDARRSAERARDLVQRILAFGRGMETERRAHDLASVADDAIALARYGLPPGVRLEGDVGAPAFVRAASAELHQICQNLISNAVHAVSAGGSVSVTVRSVSHDDGVWHCLTVSDDGVGFDARTRDRLFDPYFSTRPVGSGTGLGLPIVRSIVTSLGGHIDVASTPGHGSVFTVQLPACAAPPTVSTSDRSAVEAAALVGVRVLVVDDDDAVQRATMRLLARLGCRSEAVGDVATALERLRDAPTAWDVVLTDYRMPGLTGLDLLRAIRESGLGIALVLTSGHLADVTDDGTVPSGVVRLAKPFTRETLTSALTRAVAQAARVDGAASAHDVA